MLAMIMATGALGIDLMLPAFGDIRLHFGLPEGSNAVAGIVTAYFIGLALGQLIFGALSDRFGRKPALTIGLIGYVLAAAAASLSPTFGFLLAARLLWGVAASGPRVVAVAMVRDLYEGDRMAQAMSFIMAIFILVPVVAPSLGTAVLTFASWQWVFGVAAIFAVAVLVWSIRLPETLDPVNRRPLSPTQLLQAARLVVGQRQAMLYTLAVTFLFGSFSSYLASSELIISDILGSPGAFPFVFGGLAAIMGAATALNGTVVRRLGTRRITRATLFAYTSWSLLTLVLTITIWPRPPLWAFVVAIAPLLAAHALTVPNLNTLAMEPMASVAGTASAVIGTTFTALGAILGSLLDRAISDTVIPLAAGFAGYGVLAMALSLVADRSAPRLAPPSAATQP